MPEQPYSEQPEPIVSALGHHHLANGLVLATAILPAEYPGERFAGMPGFLFMFGLDGQPHVPVLYIPKDNDEADGLARLVAPAIETVKKYRGGWPPQPSAEVHCPGCGVKLHGPVARRGACIACFPDLPPGDGQTVGS